MDELERIAERLGRLEDPLALLEGLFAFAPDAFQVYGRDGHSLLVNRAFLDLFGSEPPPAYSIFEDEVIAARGIDALVRRGFDGEIVRTPPVWYDPRELRGVKVARGKRVAIETTMFPLFDRAKAVRYVAIVFKDVTARLELEVEQEALRKSEERYRLVFEASPLPILVYDAETLRFLAVNEAAVRYYGYSYEEFLRMAATDLRKENAHAPRGGGVPRKGETAVGIWPHVKKDGTVVEVDLATHPLTFRGKSAKMTIARDVTDQQRIEAQLRQSQKMEAVGRLAGGVAHDFNNMLSIILTYADILLGDLPPGDPKREDLTEVKRAGERAAALSQQLLAFSRKQILVPRVIDLNTVVFDVEKMLRRAIGENIALALELEPELDRVSADPAQMEQVVVNLALNARDAMPTGGRIRVETRNVWLDEAYARAHLRVEPGAHVMLAVTDEGVGMDAETRSRIFEPFFSTKGGKGTGLGLATVYGVVRQSGGHVIVESDVGRGSSFKVYFPRFAAEERALAYSSAPVAALGGKETILLVEDDPAVRRSARAILHRRGYRVLEAGSVEEALLACEAHAGRIHLLLTDVVLPGESGRVLADRLRPKMPGVKVLYMSGYTDDMILVHGLEAGLPFLQKPFTPETLAGKVREALDAEALSG